MLFLAPEPLGPDAVAASRRAAKLAEAVGRELPVTLAAPDPSTFPDGPFRTLGTGPVHDQRLAGAFAEHEVCVVQTLLSPRQLLSAIRHARHLVVDLLAPLAFEAAHMPGQGADERRAITNWRVRQLVDHLVAADLVLCTNERQRDLLMGAATAAAGTVPDPARFAVVPHGIDEDPPPPSSRPLHRAGLVADGDRLAVWAGGLWGWLDPLTPIRAVERVRERRPEVRLAFVGTGREHEGTPASGDAFAYARERGLEGDAVIFVRGWLERESYLDHLLEGEVGVSAHVETLEARYATRSRLIDYLWAGMPIACTRGDALGDFIAAEGLGAAAAPGDVEDFAAALEAAFAAAADGSERRAPEQLLWRNVARPLLEYCRDPGALPPRRRRRAALGAIREYRSFLDTIHSGGGAGAVARAAARRLRPGRSPKA